MTEPPSLLAYPHHSLPYGAPTLYPKTFTPQAGRLSCDNTHFTDEKLGFRGADHTATKQGGGTPAGLLLAFLLTVPTTASVPKTPGAARVLGTGSSVFCQRLPRGEFVEASVELSRKAAPLKQHPDAATPFFPGFSSLGESGPRVHTVWGSINTLPSLRAGNSLQTASRTRFISN